MELNIIQLALSKGAVIYSSLSGGKDSQAMIRYLIDQGLPIKGLIHAHLGRVEWPETLPHCQRLSKDFAIPLHIIRRQDGRGLLELWQGRMAQLAGRGVPFWSSSKNRYCTSNLKKGPINVFFTSTGDRFIISAEGIRAEEGKDRSKKSPLSIRTEKSSSFYKGMTPLEAVRSFDPAHKLALTWFPIFRLSLHDVWASHGVSEADLADARAYYLSHNRIPDWWPFHPAYVYGNRRVSCRYCVLGCKNDLLTAAHHDQDGLLQTLITMEERSGFTFKNAFSLGELLER